MVIYGPLTPGQVSFFLGIVPVFAAWLYSEYLEYRKNSPFSKPGRNADVSLVELAGTIKEDDRAVLLSQPLRECGIHLSHPMSSGFLRG